jgi:galactokinase
VTVHPLPHDERVATLVAAFEREFGRSPEGIAEAPGRVNLIGEHVDYNGGLVLPFAINRSVMCAWARRNHEGIWIHSIDDDSDAFYWPAQLTSPDDGDTDTGVVEPRELWRNYVYGVSYALERADLKARGLVLAITGDVPQGAGLSSSAAVEVAVAGAFRDAFALPTEDVALAQLCQRAENEFVGVQCGIMDQFASVLSQRDHALLIDCRTLSCEAVPLRLEAAGLDVVIANSAIPRELVSSAYNDRRRECEAAVIELRERLRRPELNSLRDVTQAALEEALIQGETLPLHRARHVVTEIARVAAAVEALHQSDFAELGRLMQESHQSLRDDYEVSSPELDLLVALATAQDYVLGARLTGAGFGGCTVNLVQADAIDAFARDVIAPYRDRTGRPAEIYVTPACDGLRTWRL